MKFLLASSSSAPKYQINFSKVTQNMSPSKITVDKYDKDAFGRFSR
jgi:hypothetical protein